MNIGDLFRSFVPGAPASAQQPGQAPATQQPTSNAPAQLPNGQTSQLQSQQSVKGNADAMALQQGGATPQQPGSNQQAGAQGQQQATPLADFANLWKEPKVDPNAPSDAFQPLNVDPKKLSEMAGQINFTTSLNPEIVKKALAGDANALLQVVNSSVQQGFAVATQASSALVDKQVSLAMEHMKKQLPNQFKQFSVQAAMQAENPQFSNPAVQPLLSLIQTQLASQFPDASPAELMAHAKKYMGGVVEIFAPGASASLAQQQGQQSGEDENAAFMRRMQANNQTVNNFDWDSWATAQQQSSS